MAMEPAQSPHSVHIFWLGHVAYGLGLERERYSLPVIDDVLLSRNDNLPVGLEYIYNCCAK